ncbi:DUF2293 domain-containing protein [Saccharicrinis aurantiacus]|uniref:DUF2293 domain-containing protein n=1 Tax=Saccharicrinis aurantiacus TaxID=1849719 RepID=UPI0008380BD6|nr:DUF2293 domain-containing protein [Saccharicrinis aurantiacus]
MIQCQIVNIEKGLLYDEYRNVVTPPPGWVFLPAGDAGITRKVTAKKRYWKVVFKKGRRTMSKGVWAPRDIIENAQKEVASTRSTDTYKKKQAYTKARRDKLQSEYEVEFYNTVKKHLRFDEKYKSMETILAAVITEFAIPVGSGTVARTQQIPISERAKKAVTAWMRHQTSNYDNMKIPLIKGKRREVRRNIAEESNKILDKYRKGESVSENCPLFKKVKQIAQSKS